MNQGSQVLLNGSASSGRGNLSYKWKQTDGPQVLLTSSDSVMTSFTAPSVNSTLSFELTVQDSMGMNNTDDLSIFVRDFGNNTGNNTSNVFKAEAGPDQIVYENSTVTLDGNANGSKSGPYSMPGHESTTRGIQILRDLFHGMRIKHRPLKPLLFQMTQSSPLNSILRERMADGALMM